MVNKLIVIGVDGMDYDVVLKLKNDLPNIYGMMENNGCPHLRSVFPADTTPAWTTIFSGLDPSEHGIINFVNIADRDNSYKAFEFTDEAFRGKTFWDHLNAKGYKCVVLLPMNIKDGWDINGLMITRPNKGSITVHPNESTKVYNPRADILGSEIEFTSEKQLDAVVDDFVKKFNEEHRLTMTALENEDCDMFFSYFSTIDGIQHSLWRHFDENHPEYPGATKYKDAIPEMYRRIDRCISEIREKYSSTPLLVISDHGHGTRPVYVARINEMLKREGYLAPKSSGDGINKKSGELKKLVRGIAIGFVSRFGLPKWSVKMLKKLPFWKKLFVSNADFDWRKTVAYLSDLSAMKNYSYGGIKIKKDVVNKDTLCDEIIERLSKYHLDDEDKPAFLWLKRTNTFYHGEHLDKYPEIIFQLDERYGADWNLGKELFEKKGFMHKLSPGAHRYETAVITAGNMDLDKTQYEMTDICEIIENEVKG